MRTLSVQGMYWLLSADSGGLCGSLYPSLLSYLGWVGGSVGKLLAGTPIRGQLGGSFQWPTGLNLERARGFREAGGCPHSASKAWNQLLLSETTQPCQAL